MKTFLDWLTVYATILSSLLAIPALRDILRNHLRPIRFIFRAYKSIDAIKGKPTVKISLFDVTIVNNSKENYFLSNISFELKNRNEKGSITDGGSMITVDFPNKLAPRESRRSYYKVEDEISNSKVNRGNSIYQFSLIRVVVKSSTGSIFKSKWYKHSLKFNPQTARCQRLSNIDEYVLLSGGLVEN